MFKQFVVPILLVLTVAVTLLNSSAFGTVSLIAFFMYGIAISTITALVFGRLLLKKNAFGIALPAYIKLFLMLAIYVFAQGIINNTVGITQYYWIAAALTLVCTNYWFASIGYKNGTALLEPGVVFMWGIALLVLLEALVVLLQCLYIVPVPNPFFLCTGTWVNPNVTAMFLAMGLFAVIKVTKTTGSRLPRLLAWGIFVASLLAITLLQCRSAYLATLVLITAFYGQAIKDFIKSRAKSNLGGIAFLFLLAVVALVLLNVFVSKKESAYSRVQIWGNCLELIAQRPLTGHGFGLFEREYNLYAAAKQDNTNDHIRMAYNDFLELGVEGGLPAIAIWTIFLLLAYKHFRKKGSLSGGMRPVLLAFLIIQLTNFGFQAIPAMVLFLMYLGGGDNLVAVEGPSTVANVLPQQRQGAWAYTAKAYAITVLATAVWLLYSVSGLTKLFYQQWLISKAGTNEDNIKKYQAVQQGLAGYATFHENFGDAFLYQGQAEKATIQFLKALQTTAETDVLLKCGYSYQLRGLYDSSAYYYQVVRDIQPHKFAPQLMLLKLYEQKRDSGMITATASNIINMPIKVQSKRVLDIKNYAIKVRDSCANTNTITTTYLKRTNAKM